MRRWSGVLGLLALFLGGCGWWVSPPTELFPEEILSGWPIQVDAPFLGEDLPSGAASGRGAVWARETAWIWAEVVTMADAGSAAALFAEVVSSLASPGEDRIGDEGVKVLHEPTGLVLYVFRVGPSLALVGSLAGSPEAATSPETVRQAALILAGRLPYVEASASFRSAAFPSVSLLSDTGAPVEVEVKLRGPDGTVVGTLTLRVYVSFLGESGGICRYRLTWHVARIVLREVPADGPFRSRLISSSPEPRASPAANSRSSPQKSPTLSRARNEFSRNLDRFWPNWTARSLAGKRTLP